jgi:diadenosine tetraphosphate (Ap4A) HIT family hydrolase
VPETTCIFCNLEGIRSGAVLLLENELCVFANSETLEGDLLRGSGVIIPKAHRPTVFELTPAEVGASFELLREARPLLDERYRPDGFNVGWNCYAAGGGAPHAHMHVLLRFADEPKAGQGIRWPLRQPDNRRPDPTAPGQGSRRFLGPH